MAYDGANLNLVSTAPLTGARQTWTLNGANVTGDVDAAGFITDGGSRGMRVGDMLYNYDTSTAAAVVVTGHVVNTVSSTYPGAVNLSVGVVVGTGGTSGD
jgi:hypothetical protein